MSLSSPLDLGACFVVRDVLKTFALRLASKYTPSVPSVSQSVCLAGWCTFIHCSLLVTGHPNVIGLGMIPMTPPPPWPFLKATEAKKPGVHMPLVSLLAVISGVMSLDRYGAGSLMTFIVVWLVNPTPAFFSLSRCPLR